MPTVSKTFEISEDDCRWLVSPLVSKLISDVQSSIRDGHELTSILKRLRKDTTATRSQILLQQATLRNAAAKKFALADRMFFSEKGLQQASGDSIAAHKSAKFGEAKAICDLCTGIGGDAMWLARMPSLPTITGVERCPITAFFAEANLDLLDGDHTVRIKDAANYGVADFEAWHLDPDQRSSGRRSRDVHQLSPGIEAIDRLLNENQNGCVKLSPSTIVAPEWLAAQNRLTIEFVGDRRECKQQLLWFGELACEHQRIATVVENRLQASVASDANFDVNSKADTIREEPVSGRFLIEPHASIIAAGLVDNLAQKLNLMRIETDVDYLIGAKSIDHPMFANFEIVDASAADKKQVRKMLVSHDARIQEVKKRGVDHRLMESFRGLKSSGTINHTLIVTRTNLGRRVFLCKRVMQLR